MTDEEWTSLQVEAQTLGITVNSLVRWVLRPASLPRIIEVAGYLPDSVRFHPDGRSGTANLDRRCVAMVDHP